MKTLLRGLLVLVIWTSLPAFAASSAGRKAIESEIEQLEAKRIAAILQADVKTLDQLYSDEMVYIHSGGRVDTKRGYLGLLSSGSLNYVTLKYEPAAVVHIAGPDTAVVTGRATIETKNKAGQVTKRALTTATVYVRTAAGWKIVSYQGTPVQP